MVRMSKGIKNLITKIINCTKIKKMDTNELHNKNILK